MGEGSGPKKRSLLRLLAKYLIGTAVVCVAFYGGTYLVFCLLDRSELSAARSAGIPVDPADLQIDPVVDSDNAAPIYRSAIVGLRGILPSKAERSQSVSPDAGPTSKIAAILAPYSAVLSLAEQAVQKPKCEFGHDVSLGSKFTAPEYVPLKRIVSLECAAAVLNAAQGRDAESLRKAAVAQRIAYDIGSDPNFDAQQCSIAAEGMVDRALSRMIANGAKPAFLQAARKLIEGLPPVRPIKYYAEGDLVLSRVVLHQIPSMSKAEIRDLMADNGDPRKAELENIIQWRTLNPLFDANFVSFYRSFIEKLPADNTSWQTISDDGEKADVRSSDISIPSMYTAAFAKQLRALATSAVKCETRARLIDATIQVLEAKASSGAPPATLPRLTDECSDPFTGKAFKYERVGPGFRLYSVGPEGRSDGKKNTEDLVVDFGIPKAVARRPVLRVAALGGLRRPPLPPGMMPGMGPGTAPRPPMPAR